VSFKGLIIYNGFLSSPAFFDFANMLKEAATRRNHTISLKKNDEILNELSSGNGEQFIKKYDYVLFTDKDIYLAERLEARGVPVFNRPRAIEISDDKIKTYIALEQNNIPIPKTIVAPKTFGLPLPLSSSYIERVIDKFGYPFIIKEAFGSFGEQVYLVEDKEALLFYLQKVGGKPFLFQQYISSSYGRDVRVQVVGDKVIAAMKRSASGDFRANVTKGGKMEPYEPNEYEKELAIAATKAIGAHFAGVDLLFGDGEKRYVCEVNSNAHIRNLLDCTSINVASFIIELIEKEIAKVKLKD